MNGGGFTCDNGLVGEDNEGKWNKVRFLYKFLFFSKTALGVCFYIMDQDRNPKNHREVGQGASVTRQLGTDVMYRAFVAEAK